mmetsp:Transcript_10004/g.18885  ORF Transcript_10004/g.18885 Transcript_10004/m.18885 type:complete len:85 (-) Transcript_10004:4-258(-)
MCVCRPARVRDVHLHLLLCSFRLWMSLRVSCVVVSCVVVSGGFLDVVALLLPLILSYLTMCMCMCMCMCTWPPRAHPASWDLKS